MTSYKCHACGAVITKGHLVDCCPVCKSRSISEVAKRVRYTQADKEAMYDEHQYVAETLGCN